MGQEWPSTNRSLGSRRSSENAWPGSAIRRLCYAEGASSGHRICWLGGLIYPITRSIDDYDTNMLLKAVCSVLGRGRLLREAEVIRKVARHFGFQRVSKGMKAALEKAVKAGVQTGVIQRKKGELIRP